MARGYDTKIYGQLPLTRPYYGFVLIFKPRVNPRRCRDIINKFNLSVELKINAHHFIIITVAANDSRTIKKLKKLKEVLTVEILINMIDWEES